MAKRPENQPNWIHSDDPTGYEKTPDSLLGYKKKPGENRGFAENKGREFDVKVTHESGDVHMDAIKGRNPEHALERAKRNWPGAKISLRRLGTAAAEGLLSPAGLAEDAAARIAEQAEKKRFIDEARRERKPSKSGLRRPPTKT